MKRALQIILLSFVAQSSFCADETNAAPAQAKPPTQAEVKPNSFEAFKSITQKNIFDPTRRDVRSTNEGPPPEAPKPTETFTLLGAISYDGGDFAIFDGSRSEYRKSVKAGESIAGYRLAQVKPGGVSLENSGKTVELPVGWQMKRQGDEEWKASMRTDSSDFSASSSSSSERSRSEGERGDRSRFDRGGDRSRGDRERFRSSSDGSSSARPIEPAASSSSSGSSDQNEVLRRLIEQRRRGE